jgi:uncharacterized membrane protein
VEDDDQTGIRRGRLEGISDGIIAVAITLLALGIEAPIPKPGETLMQAFDAQTLGAIGLFALSFFLIARFWLVHHRLFAGLPSTVPPEFVVLNFAFLAVICLVPFATTTYSRNPTDMAALVIYTAVIAGATILLSVMFRRSTTHSNRRSLYIPLVLISAIPVGLLIGPRYAPIVWILLLFGDAARFGRPKHADG